MIKINLDNEAVLRADLIVRVEAIVRERLRAANFVLSYVNGNPIPFPVDLDIDFIRNATKRYMMLNGGSATVPSVLDYNRNNFHASFSDYTDNNLNTVPRTQQVMDLFDHLIEQPNYLSEFLLTPADDLITVNDDNLNDFGVNQEDDKGLLMLAFDYDDFSNCKDALFGFYRLNNFPDFYPYCNLDRITYIENTAQETAAGHHLDHFYDKARHPLLCYSMYNLVPSDYTCNSTNKGTKKFLDEFHLNPYSEGFTDRFVFDSIYNKNDREYELIIHRNGDMTSTKNKKIYGNAGDIDETSELGNANVFNIMSRYEEEKTRIDKVMNDLKEFGLGYFTSNIAYLSRFAKHGNLSDYYKNWYFKNFSIRFDEDKHGSERYSKLTRDLHDKYRERTAGKIALIRLIRKVTKINP